MTAARVGPSGRRARHSAHGAASRTRRRCAGRSNGRPTRDRAAAGTTRRGAPDLRDELAADPVLLDARRRRDASRRTRCSPCSSAIARVRDAARRAALHAPLDDRRARARPPRCRRPTTRRPSSAAGSTASSCASRDATSSGSPTSATVCARTRGASRRRVSTSRSRSPRPRCRWPSSAWASSAASS